jgi:GGDEF domain-containing protein
MEPIARLIPLVGRFQSFAEAAEVSLNGLARAVPGAVILGQFDSHEEVCRVTDHAGIGIDGLARGVRLPLAGSVKRDGNRLVSGLGSEPGGDWLDGEFLRSLSVESWLTLPLEVSDGNVVGLLCAFAPEAGVYQVDHVALLGVAARMLSYEWERVQTRAELRSLRNRVGNGQNMDTETGLANREGFVGLLDREWKLAKRGTVRTVVVAFHVKVSDTHHGPGSPLATLAVKDAAAVLAGTTRATDHVGRVRQMDLAAILVGCDGAPGAEAFIRRYQGALERASRARPVSIAVSWGFQALEDADSPVDALSRAENAALSASAHGAGERPSVGERAGALRRATAP